MEGHLLNVYSQNLDNISRYNVDDMLVKFELSILGLVTIPLFVFIVQLGIYTDLNFESLLYKTYERKLKIIKLKTKKKTNFQTS